MFSDGLSTPSPPEASYDIWTYPKLTFLYNTIDFVYVLIILYTIAVVVDSIKGLLL